MARGPLMNATYNGMSLEQIHELLAFALDEADEPLRVEDAMTKIGLFDPFDRQVIKRTFMVTLKPGGVNYKRLTVQAKWAKGREKWAEQQVRSGKVNLTFTKVTGATRDLTTKIESLNGDLSLDVQQAASSIAVSLAARANAKLDKGTLAIVAEDVATILADNAALARENALHEKYRKQNEAQMQMLQALVAKLTGEDTSFGMAAK